MSQKSPYFTTEATLPVFQIVWKPVSKSLGPPLKTIIYEVFCSLAHTCTQSLASKQVSFCCHPLDLPQYAQCIHFKLSLLSFFLLAAQNVKHRIFIIRLSVIGIMASCAFSACTMVLGSSSLTHSLTDAFSQVQQKTSYSYSFAPQVEMFEFRGEKTLNFYVYALFSKFRGFLPYNIIQDHPSIVKPANVLKCLKINPKPLHQVTLKY